MLLLMLLLMLLVAIGGSGCGGKPPPPGIPTRVQIENLPAGWDPTARGAGASITAAARLRLGAPYRYGGTTQQGYDCSGLVYRVFLDHGLHLPRTVRQQVQAGTAVGRPAPGDLVFFRLRGNNPSHVGIYLGEGRFIHASSGRRQVVTDDLNRSEYFRRRYAGARRIVPMGRSD